MSENEKLWLIYSREHSAWWRPNSNGYTSRVEDAGRYTKADADAICRNGGHQRAWSNREGPYEEAVLAPETAAHIDAQAARIAELERERDATREGNAALADRVEVSDRQAIEATLAKQAAEAERDRLLGVVRVVEERVARYWPGGETHEILRNALSPQEPCKTCGDDRYVMLDADGAVPCPDCRGGDHG